MCQEIIERIHEESTKQYSDIPPPKYDIGDVVSFCIDGKKITGTVFIVDRYGTFFQTEEPSYDVMVEDDKVNILYKHIRQSKIIE